MNKNKIVPIVRWVPLGESPKQCLDEDPSGSYDTLCGTDINDPGRTSEPGTTAESKAGRVTCEHCISVINAVLKHYGESRKKDR